MRSTGFEPMTPAWKAGMLTTTLTSQLLYLILEENFYGPNFMSRDFLYLGHNIFYFCK